MSQAIARPDFVLIWGLSGAGKSRYCTWLVERGYLYLDNDTIAQRINDGTASGTGLDGDARRGSDYS